MLKINSSTVSEKEAVIFSTDGKFLARVPPEGDTDGQ